MQKIIDYIIKTYNPLSVIVYGSYADGSNNENSDFDAFVLVKGGKAIHDTAIVENIQMDAWVYPVCKFKADFDSDEIIQIFDGRIVLDTNNIGRDIKNKVEQHIAELPFKSEEEAREELEWCKKMLLRTERKDAEGMYRWHWLVTDSLQIACDVLGHHYFGVKKAIKWIKHNHPDIYEIYTLLLKAFNPEAMTLFINKLDRHISPDIPTLDREIIRKDLQCKIYPLGYLERYKYTVICSSFNGKWIMSKHKKRNTWETQGGHIEAGETPLECAKRELFEESGIKDADFYPVCDYWGFNSQACSNGMVFLAVVHSLGELPESEMKEIKIFDKLPQELTYPQTSPKLYAEAEKLLKRMNKTIKTERLILRPLTIADADDAYEWLTDPQVTRFMSYLQFTSKQQVEEWLVSIKDEANIFAYCLADSGKVIGSGGIAYHPEEKAYRLGYNLNRAYWGKGYATEAAGAMLKWAYTELGARDFCCHHANANVASQNVINKLGFIFDHYGQFSKYDNSETFDASFYVMHLD